MSKVHYLTIYFANYDELAALTLPNLTGYCAKHGYTFKPQRGPYGEGQVGFQETQLIYDTLFLEKNDIELLWAVHIDCVVTNPDITIESFVDDEHDFFVAKNWDGINNGSFVVRKTQWLKEYLEYILSFNGRVDDEQSVINFNTDFKKWNRIKILEQPSLNSFYCGGHPLKRELLGTKCDWKPGHFLLHLTGLSLDYRLQILRSGSLSYHGGVIANTFTSNPSTAVIPSNVPYHLTLKANKGNSGCLFPYLKVLSLFKTDFLVSLDKDISSIPGYLTQAQIPLVFLIANFTKGRIAEIGVLYGRTTVALAHGSVSTNLEIHCVDTFLGSGEEHKVFTAGGSFKDQFEKTIRERRIADRVIVNEGLSKEIAASYADGYFDAVFIDGAHDYENVSTDINSWYPKLKSGGLMFGHDYSEPLMPNRDFLELVVAVDKYVKNDAKFTDFGWFNGIWAAIKI